MANYGGYQPYPNYGAPNNYAPSPRPPTNNPAIPPPYPSASYSSPSPNPISAGSYSPYPQLQPGYNRPPPAPPGLSGYPPYQQQQQQQQPYGQQPPQQYGYGGQQQPQPYGGQLGYGQQAQGQYGQYGQPPQGQYGAPPQQVQAGPAEIAAYKQLLQSCIQEKQLQTFYPPNSPMLDQIASRAPALINQVIQRWRIAKEVANDIVKLALYDIVLYIDDSGSMQFEEEGSRIKDLRLILERVSFAATLFDADGISVRFMNTDLAQVRDQGGRPLQDGVANESQIETIMRGVQFKGLTPMGTSLRQKVIDGIVMQKASSGQLRKPILVITITDGQPAGEPQNAVFDTIRYAFDTLQQRFPQYGRGALAFEFAQVGNDEMAKKFLGKLDEDSQIGLMVDCTSNFENEQEEMARANPPVDLTPDLWIVKLLLGAIDASYDTKDEKTNRPAGGAPGGYGAPPQQYGAPQGYGAPPPGQYGAPPQPGGYGAPQQGYGAPPQQGGYGAPPPGQYPGQGQYPQQGGRGGGPGGYPGQQPYGQPPPPGRY
ncbi:uncharacterized protein BDR25DRAFT_304751 [Lindgomyces ingoldianus]|uniref:Uncharacterized protein n=1 Tax=Lindgomyces ingoldianus TaxID=673940 RepID=A0ACB6QPJ2_9PLEO|nr:uncharacterized protein BDR25DRAFT_304751 [Lindgomyces ingoldianus]KAF2468767.1 hypothetical protein BDR25DRAFT_304751 [Lindgomyces ingoldianus]